MAHKRSALDKVTVLNRETRGKGKGPSGIALASAPASAWAPQRYPGLRNILRRQDPAASDTPSANNTDSSIEGGD